jgi:hypothetical protein
MVQKLLIELSAAESLGFESRIRKINKIKAERDSKISQTQEML